MPPSVSPVIPAFITWMSYPLRRSMACNRAGKAFSRPTKEIGVLTGIRIERSERG